MKYLFVLIFISFILCDNNGNEQYNEQNGYDEINYNDSSISYENNEVNDSIDTSEYEVEEEPPDGIYQIKTLDQFTLNNEFFDVSSQVSTNIFDILFFIFLKRKINKILIQ